MNFPRFIQNLLEETVARTGATLKKERAKGNATDSRSKDAARKRVERSRQIPRDRKPKQELVKEVVAVRTRSGRVQLIFKDSFNKELHEKLSKESLSMEEARQLTNDPKFEQTRASKLLFGNVKEKPKGEGQKEGKKEEGEKKESKAKEGEGKEEKAEPKKKAKRLSKDDIFKAMSQMDGNQLAQMPLEMRQEYFKATRQPPSNIDFDNMTYEALTVKFAISPVSSLPYNQQVLNALVFLAKMKAGASEQEMQTYTALAPTATEFTRTAFNTARKILSQIGDECIQNLVSTVETGGTPVNSEGATDMQCGNYKFKVSAGGEMSFSSTQFDQQNKSFKGLLANALMQTLSNPQVLNSDPKIAELMQTTTQNTAQFSTMLIPDELLGTIMQDESLVQELQKMKLKDSTGADIGPVIDEDGNLNPRASMNNYRNQWLDASKQLFRGGKSSEKSPLRAAVVSQFLKSNLRGDNVVPPEMAPNHLVTINGIFPMTDDYFNMVSQQADVDVKQAKDVINSSNIGSYKNKSAETLKKFRTIVEAEEKKGKKSLKDILINSKDIDPLQLMVRNIVDNNDFLLNVSLLPGFSPKDLNAVEYNYVTIGKKTIKIPVLNNEKIANQVINEAFVFVNDMLIEALTKNFVLQGFVQAELLNDSEEELFLNDSSILLEGMEEHIPLQGIYQSVMERINESPERLASFITFLEEAERDYKKEYKNYHGKPKQRKERAARTAARELMIKKGKVRKGDGKDIDHKKPLRNGGSKGLNNLRVRDKSSNRSDNGHKKGETQDKGSWK